MIGSQAHDTEVTFSDLIRAMSVDAWVRSVGTSSVYASRSDRLLPSSARPCSNESTHCWYSRLLGAITAMVRGLPCRSPPANSASRPRSRLLVYSADSSLVTVQSGKVLQA